MKERFIKAFTLAEAMITLTIIGVISAIVVPVAVNSRPDENVMKFKKAHKTLYQVINTLVTSDKYYLNGDLGIRADGTLLTHGVSTYVQYFCLTFADLLSTKSVNCVNGLTDEAGGGGAILLSDEAISQVATGIVPCVRPVTQESIAATKEWLDRACKKSAKSVGAEIVTTDGIAYYNTRPYVTFGIKNVTANEANGLEHNINIRYFSPPNRYPADYADEFGNDISYKAFCVDIDGIPDNATRTDCKNECPFGYGIRADGKILNGERADEWLEKDIQGEN